MSALSSQTMPRLPVLTYNPRWHYAKVTMRLLIVVLAACIWALFASDPVFSEVLGPVMIVDVVWQFVEFIVLARTRKTSKKGIHPIAHLVADVLLWAAYFSITVAYAVVICSLLSENNPMVHFSVKLAINVLSHLIWVLHLVLLIRDCVEVHRYRRSKSASDVVYFVPRQDASPHSEGLYDPEANQMADAASNMSSLHKPSVEMVEPKSKRI